jgi:hypothetical protein
MCKGKMVCSVDLKEDTPGRLCICVGGRPRESHPISARVPVSIGIRSNAPRHPAILAGLSCDDLCCRRQWPHGGQQGPIQPAGTEFKSMFSAILVWLRGFPPLRWRAIGFTQWKGRMSADCRPRESAVGARGLYESAWAM